MEINALWHGALCLMADWGKILDDPAAEDYRAEAARVRDSFRASFWNPQRECLYDVLTPEGPDARLRPNQIFAVSLPFGLLEAAQQQAVVRIVERELLTSVGLRTLERSDPDYKPRYQGSPAERDAAYHQGTVWPWLLGPFIDAYLTAFGKTPANLAYCRDLVAKLEAEAAQAGCVGSIAEIYDADEPQISTGLPCASLECGGNRAAKSGLRLGFLIPALETFGRPGRLRQDVCLNAPAAEYAPSVGALVEPDEGVRNVLEMRKLAIVYLEELNLHIPVQRAFQRHCQATGRFSQSERFHRLGQMHQQPFSRRVGAADGHGASIRAQAHRDRY